MEAGVFQSSHTADTGIKSQLPGLQEVSKYINH